MKQIRHKILKKTVPVILPAILMLMLGVYLRIVTDSSILRILSFLMIAITVMVLSVLGNPISKFEKQLEQLGYTTEILATDLGKGVSYGNIDLGTQFLVNYGVFTKIISFQDVLWTYLDTANLLHFITKDNIEYTVSVESKEIALSIVKQMEKGCPWILFGYLEEVAQLRETDFEELKELYTGKLLECVVQHKLPENPLYPLNRPTQDVAKESESSTEPFKPPYPVQQAMEIQNVRVPDSSLSEYFTKLVQLCKDYPEEIHGNFYAPAKSKEITAFEKRNKLSLPAQLKDLLLFSNGFSLKYDDYYSLQKIEYALQSWGPLKDVSEAEYIMIASVVGDGENIVFSKETGIIYWEDHGEFTEYGTLDKVLYERLEFIEEDLGVE